MKEQDCVSKLTGNVKRKKKCFFFYYKLYFCIRFALMCKDAKDMQTKNYEKG